MLVDSRHLGVATRAGDPGRMDDGVDEA
jgi:hypothetical protein